METGASVWTHAPAQPRQTKRDDRRRQGWRRGKWRINSRNNASVLQRARERETSVGVGMGRTKGKKLKERRRKRKGREKGC